MNAGTKEIKDSSLEEEKKKFGENLKEMGKMSHRGANESVRKEATKMGHNNNVQVEAELGSEAEVSQASESGEQAPVDEAQENKELLKKIDLDGMFKKIKSNSTTNTAQKKTKKKGEAPPKKAATKP